MLKNGTQYYCWQILESSYSPGFLFFWVGKNPKRKGKQKQSSVNFTQDFLKKNGPKSPYFKEEKTLKSTYLNNKFQHVAETKLNPVKF
jgi:hypothetical protein